MHDLPIIRFFYSLSAEMVIMNEIWKEAALSWRN